MEFVSHLLYKQAPTFWSNTACAAGAAALGWNHSYLGQPPTPTWEKFRKTQCSGRDTVSWKHSRKFLQDHRKRSRSTDVFQFKQSRDQERKAGERQGKPWKGSTISRFYLPFQFQHFHNPFQQCFSFFSSRPTALAIAKFWSGGGTFILKPWHSLSWQVGPYFLLLQSTGCSEDGNWHYSCEDRWARAQELSRGQDLPPAGATREGTSVTSIWNFTSPCPEAPTFSSEESSVRERRQNKIKHDWGERGKNLDNSIMQAVCIWKLEYLIKFGSGHGDFMYDWN